jgi:ABC-type multidrug transport system fused ATPase/permease subunit
MIARTRDISVFRRLIPYLRPHARTIGLSLILLLAVTPAGSFHPLVWRYVVDDVIGRRHLGHLLPALIVMFAVQGFGTAVGALRDAMMERVGQKMVFAIRNDVYAKLQRQSLGYLHDHRTGDLIARAMGDVDVLQDVAVQGLDAIVSNLLGFLWVAGVLIALNARLGVATLAPIAVVFLLTRFFNARVKAIYKGVRDRLGDVNARLQENLNGMALIKAFAKEPYESARFREATERYMRVNFGAIRARNLFFPGVRFVGFLSNIIAVGYGAWLTVHGQFTVGGLVAYRGYWWPLFQPINQLATINEMLQRAQAAGRRVFHLLDEPESVTDRPDAAELSIGAGGARVEFRDVSFGYGDRPVLCGISFAAEPGEMVALVGPSGAGKTTVLNLIPRFWDPKAGQILVDGKDIRSVTQRSLRRHLAIVQQDTFLFGGAVLDNIRYGRQDAGMAEVESAARAANAHDFIMDLPQGYATEIGERGVKLSGGQRQRLAIARAFLANPEILILDEPTSSVEPESETIITQALERLMQGRTTFVTSHRFSLVRGANRILVFSGGSLTEAGTHAELIAGNGLYASMYAMQMG